MCRFFIAVSLLLLYADIHAGCAFEGIAYVNNVQIFSFRSVNQPPEVHTGWIGKCYVDSVKGDIFRVYAHVYFKKGDTLDLGGVGVVTYPGIYEGTLGGIICPCDQHFVCSYLNDTLEMYYLSHFDEHFIDSMTVVQKAFKDSVAAVPATFYPNPVSESITFECFKTVEEPFDFYAYDLQGRCILTRRVEFSNSYHTKTIDVSSLESGTYIVRYFLNKRQYTRHIVKL